MWVHIFSHLTIHISNSTIFALKMYENKWWDKIHCWFLKIYTKAVIRRNKKNYICLSSTELQSEDDNLHCLRNIYLLPINRGRVAGPLLVKKAILFYIVNYDVLGIIIQTNTRKYLEKIRKNKTCTIQFQFLRISEFRDQPFIIFFRISA